MKISVVGTGYVGLVVGACFAEGGHDVICVDIDPKKVDRLQKGGIPIFEPRLEELVKRNVAHKRLRFTTDLALASKEASVVFITVGTPALDNWEADVKGVIEVARGVARAMDGHRVIVIKSTVSVGTAEKVRAAMRELTDHPFDLCANPEFLKAGGAVDDFMKPDRVVIGVDNNKTAEIMKELYAPFAGYAKQFIITGIREAELIKYAANSMLATRISFMNEFANLCEKLGANVDDVRRGLGSDERIGYAFLFPGVGYGGSCFPKDVRALMKTADAAGSPLTILEAVDRVNRRQVDLFFEKITKHLGNLNGKTLALWGLAFKPNTDDIREAPALRIIERALEAGAKIQACDPEAVERVRPLYKEGVSYFTEPYDALSGADALVLVTEWPEFRNPDFTRIKKALKGKAVFDGRNIFDPAVMAKHGFDYYGIGIPSNTKSN